MQDACAYGFLVGYRGDEYKPMANWNRRRTNEGVTDSGDEFMG